LPLHRRKHPHPATAPNAPAVPPCCRFCGTASQRRSVAHAFYAYYRQHSCSLSALFATGWRNTCDMRCTKPLLCAQLRPPPAEPAGCGTFCHYALLPARRVVRLSLCQHSTATPHLTRHAARCAGRGRTFLCWRQAPDCSDAPRGAWHGRQRAHSPRHLLRAAQQPHHKGRAADRKRAYAAGRRATGGRQLRCTRSYRGPTHRCNHCRANPSPPCSRCRAAAFCLLLSPLTCNGILLHADKTPCHCFLPHHSVVAPAGTSSRRAISATACVTWHWTL